MSTKALSVVIATVVALLMVDSAAALSAEWWNNSWHYRVNVTVNTSIYNRTDWPVEYNINFSDFPLQGAFDNNSVRVIEFNTTNNASYEVTSQFDQGEYYDNTTNAYGEVLWLLNGTRPENTILQYYIYFDSTDFGLKAAPNYASDLTFINYEARIFGVNNTLLDLRVHTDPNINHTSGLYFAQFRGTGDIVFNSSSSNTIEYIRYKDTSPSQYVYYDFRNNFQVEHAGPVKITVKQQGDENIWGTTTGTGEANMTKRYAFYQNNQWIKIEQTLTTKTALPGRETDATEALLIDVGRTNINPDIEGGSGGAGADPFSWASIIPFGPAYLGMGIINLNETDSRYYVDDYQSDPVNKMGVTYSPARELASGESISQTACLYFNDVADHGPISELRNRFMNETTSTQASVEERTVALVPQTNYDLYNRNETVFIVGNITSDYYNLSYSANATVTNPSGVNTTVNLTKNGTIYGGNYTIGIGDEVGVWTLTTRTYDDNEYLLNTTAKTFNVTNVYILEIKLLNPIGLVNQSMWANMTVKTLRNDTGIPGISWPNISCAFYNASDSSQVTNVTGSNTSEAPTGFGNYTANWTGPKEGYWNLTCNASRFNNTGTANVTFLTTVKNTTQLDLTLNTTAWLSAPYNVSFVKWNENQTFIARFNVTNIELGLAKAVNVTFNFTGAGWWVSNISNPYQIGDLLPLQSRIIDLEITVPNRTNPGLYNVTANATWENFVGTKNDTLDWFNVTVDSNPVLEVIQPGMNLTVWENTTEPVNFTVFSAGNDHLTDVTYSCTPSTSAVCSDFTPVFNPTSITLLNRGEVRNVTVDFAIPDGWPNGSYVGNITVTYNSQIVNVTVNVTVPASRNWTMNRTTCFKAALPDSTGDVCEVEIDNTGNVDLQFNITPNTNSTSLENYTYSNETLFTVVANTTKVIRFIYNTTGAPAHTNITNYTINATDPLANPDNNTLTVTLDVVLGPDLDFFNITPSELAQLDNLTINATITDRLRVGTSASDIWVSANISWPNGTLIETVNLTNTTPLSPGATSNWSLDYNNTRYRGINFSVTLFTQDRLGGYNESTQEKNFTVYAKLALDIMPNRESLRYDPGDTAKFYIAVNDSNFEPLAEASVTIDIYDANDWLVDTKTETTDSDGRAVTGTFTVDEPIGDWSWIAEVEYYDSVVGKNVTANTSGKFKVDYEKIVDVQTDDTQYKGTSFPVKVFITQQGNLVTVSENVTVRLSFNGSTIQSKNATLFGDYYEATMSLATNASEGAYLAKVTAYDGGTKYDGYKAFDVPDAPAQSLTLELTSEGVYKPGDSVQITAFLSDQDSNYLGDANITLTITDPDNNAILLNMTAINSTTPPKYTATYALPDNATLGPYTLFGNVTYGGVYTSDVDVFVVSETLYTKVAVGPAVYLNETMNISITVLNPITGQGIDPDEMTLILYRTEGGMLVQWKNLTKSDFLAGESPGLYNYSEVVDSSTPTGSYIALLEIKEGSYRVWGMETFNIQTRLVYDVIIESITDPLSRGEDLDFTVNITNMGEFVPEADVVVRYWIDDGTKYSGSEQRKIKPTGESDVFTKNFSSVDLPDGAHLLFVSVSYQGVAVATASKTFQIGAAAPPPSGAPSPPGAGPGPKKEVGIDKLSIIEFYPPEVHVERGGIAYLLATVENLGGTTLTDISAEVAGIPEDWYELIKGEVEELKSGDSSDILIQIKVPNGVAAQAVVLTVKATSTEVSYERSLIMRIFSSREDLVYFEIESVKKTMRNSEDRALRALNEGKNVTEVMEKIDEVRLEIRQAENFLSQGEYEKALGHLDNARELLEHVNELIEFLRIEEAPPVAPVVIPAPGIGVSTPVLMFLFFVIAALAGIVIFLTRDRISNVFNMIGMPTVKVKRGGIGMPTVKVKRAGIGRPTVKKARTRRVSAEVRSQANSLEEEIRSAERLLGTMKSQYEAGLISDSTYKELKNRNEKKIKTAKSKLKKLGV